MISERIAINEMNRSYTTGSSPISTDFTLSKSTAAPASRIDQVDYQSDLRYKIFRDDRHRPNNCQVPPKRFHMKSRSDVK